MAPDLPASLGPSCSWFSIAIDQLTLGHTLLAAARRQSEEEGDMHFVL